MMAAKARLFSDETTFSKIIETPSPRDAKSLGREVQGFRDELWVEHRFRIVVDGNLAKFEQNWEMGSVLLSTGKMVLVEASPRDAIWGIGLSRDGDHARDPAQWRGLNLLGFALMEVRSRLMEA